MPPESFLRFGYLIANPDARLMSGGAWAKLCLATSDIRPSEARWGDVVNARRVPTQPTEASSLPATQIRTQ